MNNGLKLLFVLLVFSFHSVSQNTRIQDVKYFMYEDVFSDVTDMHLSIKPFSYEDILKADSSISNVLFESLSHPIFNKAISERKSKDLTFKINPLIGSSLIYTDKDEMSYDLRVGSAVEFSYKKRLFFSADYLLSMTNVYAQTHYQDLMQIVPHFETTSFIRGKKYYYNSFSGEVAYKASENLYFQLGKGKHFFGNGYRSLFLSDNSNAYNYFKVTADIWKIKYIWLAGQTRDIQLYDGSFDYNLYKKAFFLHYFSLNLTKRINIDFFESVITNPYDLNGNNSGYEWSYFNPVIFYRPVEFYNGTSDNSLMGVGLNLRLFNSLHVYSQFILDDLIISRINDGTGWWGNKYGVQAGLKAFNFMNVEGFFIRCEINFVRPYTYTHGQVEESNDIANLNYGSYVQALAHPLGANFVEGIAQVKYMKGRFIAEAQLNLARKGTDPLLSSFGGNIYKSYNLRPGDTDISFLQGDQNDFIYAKTGASYILNPALDLMINAFVQYRKNKGAEIDNNLLFNIGISTNIFNERTDSF